MIASVARSLAVAATLAWGLTALAVLLALGTIGQRLREPAFLSGEAICVALLALSLLSLWLSRRGFAVAAFFLSTLAIIAAAIALGVLYMAMRGV